MSNIKRYRKTRRIGDGDPDRMIDSLRSITPGTVKQHAFSPWRHVGHVYLFYAQATNQYKIGITVGDPNIRRRQIETIAGVPIVLIEHWDIGSDLMSIEMELHTYFKQYRTIGEWFRFPDNLCEEDVRSLIERWMNGFAESSE